MSLSFVAVPSGNLPNPEVKKGGVAQVDVISLSLAGRTAQKMMVDGFGYAPVRRKPDVGLRATPWFLGLNKALPEELRHYFTLQFQTWLITQSACRQPIPQTAGSSSLPSRSGLAALRVTSFGRFPSLGKAQGIVSAVSGACRARHQ